MEVHSIDEKKGADMVTKMEANIPGMDEILQLLRGFSEKRTADEADNSTIQEWQGVAMVVDRLGFLFVVLSTVIVSIVMLSSIDSEHDFKD